MTGNLDVEDSLERLDKLTQEEARMASAELLRMMRSIDGKVMGVDDRVKGIEGKIQDVYSDVHDVGNKVEGVDDNSDQVKRSFSFQPLLLIPSTHTSPQGTSSEIVISDGFRPQIHLSIMTLHATLVTTLLLNGLFKQVYSINGNPLVPSCGYTANVRFSWPSPSIDS